MLPHVQLSKHLSEKSKKVSPDFLDIKVICRVETKIFKAGDTAKCILYVIVTWLSVQWRKLGDTVTMHLYVLCLSRQRHIKRVLQARKEDQGE